MKERKKRMNKKEFVDKLAEKGYTKKDAGCIIDDVFAVVTDALINGEEVKLYGFGVFSVVEYGPRTTLDLHTKQPIEIPAWKTPKFAPGDRLRRAIKEGFVRE